MSDPAIAKTTAELEGDYPDGDDLVVVPRWALLAQRHPIGHPDRYASRERLCFEADNGPILVAEDGRLYAGERGDNGSREDS